MSEVFAAYLTQLEALERLETALAHSRTVVRSLTLADLEERRRVNDQPEVTVAWALLHAAIHLGHAQLMRQWWEAQAS